MASTKTLFACLLLLAVFTSQTLACGKRADDEKPDKPSVDDSKEDETKPSTQVNACCVCGQPIDVTLHVSNQIREPYFEMSTEVNGHPQNELLHFLEVAATKDPRFRFSTQHWGSLGYMVTGINKVVAGSSDYWRISSHINKDGLPSGLSFYVPMHKESIMFNLTKF